MARILIFEPQADIRALLELIVQRLGHEAVSAAHTAVACDGFDAAVIEPADGSGVPLARRLRREGTPVIFTSIFPADRRLLALSPASYLVKPFSVAELQSALRSALCGPAPLDAA